MAQPNTSAERLRLAPEVPTGNREFQLADAAYAALARAIATCQLAPGSQLNERDQSAELDMSRTPFRQALHRLALEGLVVSFPRRGVYVTLLDLDDVQHNLELRLAVETALVHRVLAEGRDINVAELEELVEVMKQAEKRHDAPSFLSADENFHLTLCAAAGNARAMDTLKRTWVHVNRARYLQPPHPTEMRDSRRQHAAILKAVRAGDPDDTITAIRTHVKSAAELFGDLRDKMPFAFVDQAAHVGRRSRVR